ncbi:hypothetical protein [Pyxidicoccus sp. MSG2]|nr:hypothetical protein [Pyxidicoccus sp. MSG2]MCY1021604.1 hypothetical protein [Pyxidicoccus sp. MSG2]
MRYNLAMHMALSMVEALVHSAVLEPPATGESALEEAFTTAVEGYLVLRR